MKKRSILRMVIIAFSITVSISQAQNHVKRTDTSETVVSESPKNFEKEILNELRLDLMQNLNDINSNIGALKLSEKANRIIIDHMEENIPYNDSLDYYFANLYPYLVFSPNETTFNFLKEKGMSLISNDSIRLAVSDLYGVQYGIYKAYESVYFVEHYTNYVKPMFIAEFETFKFYNSFKPRNYSEFVKNEEYRRIMSYTADAIQTFIYMQSGLKTMVENLIDDIEKEIDSSHIETFAFSSNGDVLTGRVYLPEAYGSNKDLPVVYLVDFTEQHFKIATDEFERVVDGVRRLRGVDALVVSLANIPDIDAEPAAFSEHFQIYKDMASYVDNNYSDNPSRTFVGKGSESGLVLMSLFVETAEDSLFDKFVVTDPSPHYVNAIASLIKEESFPLKKNEKKLHFSFSTSNDRTKCTMLIDLIQEASYPWLEFEAKEYKESNYENTYPLAYAAGLDFVFK